MAFVESRSEASPSPEASNANVQTQVGPQVYNQGTYSEANKIVGMVNEKFTNWRSLRRSFEIQWYIAAAMLAGLHNVRWNDSLAQLEAKAVPAYKMVPTINIVLPKTRQRKAKFLKNRYVPVIVPATSDKEDKLNARASQLALSYVARKRKLESVYWDALDWALTTGKGFIWIYWDSSLQSKVKVPPEVLQQMAMSGQPLPKEIDPQTGTATIVTGDVTFDAGSPFEVLVPDISVKTIGGQHEIMRVRAVPLEEIKLRYKDVAGIENLKGDLASSDTFQYQKQIATLGAKAAGAVSAQADKSDKDLNMVIRKEWFARPCGKYPNGAYAVIAGTMLLKYQEVLPFGFQTDANPYPVVEFADIQLAGQFWPTSTVQQLGGIQREYNDYRSKLKNHLAKSSHPKIIASIYSKWPADAWTDEAGEVIKILTPPGVPAPQVITPAPISGDIWRAMELLRGEADLIANLPPAAPSGPGGPQSGFQLNMMLENVDSVHAPDIRQHEASFEELYGKIRKIMAQGYDIPRLISVSGKSHIPDEVEFSQANIDEEAEIIVYTGTALSNSPAIRTQQVIELWNAGILQDPTNPVEGQRKALAMLDAVGTGEFQEKAREDEEEARVENLAFERGQQVLPPIPFHNHFIHYESHCSQMKSPDFKYWDDARKKEIYAHTIYHMKFINPQQAVNTALELGLVELIPFLMPPMMPGQTAANQAPNGQSSSEEPAKAAPKAE